MPSELLNVKIEKIQIQLDSKLDFNWNPFSPHMSHLDMYDLKKEYANTIYNLNLF